MDDGPLFATDWRLLTLLSPPLAHTVSVLVREWVVVVIVDFLSPRY